MAVPSRLQEEYSRALPTVEAVARHVERTIRTWCDRRGYLFSGRIKTAESLAEKIESGRFERWSLLDDLYACTVVVPTSAHENEVLSFLARVYSEVDLRRRNSTKKSPEVFRFDCTRFIGRIKEKPELGYPPGVSLISFEVQIPSAFEHAWSLVTHDLVYKSSDVDWRKTRLAAQLKAAVEQIELIIAGFQANLDFVAQSSYPEVDAKQKIVACFQDLMDDGSISKELTPQSWSRFADNVYDLVKSYARSSAAPYKVESLLKAVEKDLRRSKAAASLVSGSLFQVVIGCVNRGVATGASLDNHPILDSPELRTLHGVTQIPKPFVFD